jgi:hypothetical protein
MSWAKVYPDTNKNKIWVELPGVGKFTVSPNEARDLAANLDANIKKLRLKQLVKRKINVQTTRT